MESHWKQALGKQASTKILVTMSAWLSEVICVLYKQEAEQSCDLTIFAWAGKETLTLYYSLN